ncbi:MAG: DNRLRE domain-containing protein [Bryobacteraceae bacterium]
MRTFWVALIAAGLLALPAMAVDLPVIADASVGASVTPSGALPNLLVGGGNRSLLRFELGVLPAGLPPAQVVKATLILHVNRVNAAGPVKLSLLQGQFAEATVTSATAPPAGGLVGVANLVAGPNLIDVTAAVQQWVGAPASAFGLDLSVDPSAATNVQVDSKENTATSYAAVIRVVLSGPQGVAGVRGPTGPTGPTGPVATYTPQMLGAMCDLYRLLGTTAPAGYPCPDKLVFLTEGRWAGNLGGLAGADAKCASEAAASGKKGTFKAWLSTATVSASSRLVHSNLPYARPDGVRVAMNWDDLTDGTLLNPIIVTASGLNIAGYLDYGSWTNTSTSGGTLLSSDCQGWTTNSSSEAYVQGSALGTVDRSWTQSFLSLCDMPRHLYCFEQ